jgi:hypothetical protein
MSEEPPSRLDIAATLEDPLDMNALAAVLCSHLRVAGVIILAVKDDGAAAFAVNAPADMGEAIEEILNYVAKDFAARHLAMTQQQMN